MNSNRPYLIRAIWEWISDNHLTPYLLVNANYPGVEVPQPFVQDGKIVLNISATAVHNLSLENDYISFNARFSGTPWSVLIPVEAVLGIYAKENGQGMLFPEEQPSDPAPEPEPPKPKGKPQLKVIK